MKCSGEELVVVLLVFLIVIGYSIWAAVWEGKSGSKKPSSSSQEPTDIEDKWR